MLLTDKKHFSFLGFAIVYLQLLKCTRVLFSFIIFISSILFFFFSVSLNFLRWLLYYCNEMCHNMFLHFNLAFWIKVFFLLRLSSTFCLSFAIRFSTLCRFTVSENNWNHKHTHTYNVMEQRRETIFVSFLFFRLFELGVLPLALWKKISLVFVKVDAKKDIVHKTWNAEHNVQDIVQAANALRHFYVYFY